jgi:DNA-binding NtrC family response regulator
MSYHAPQNYLTGTNMIMLLTYRAELREQITKSLKAMGHELCLPAHRTDVTAMKESPPDLVILDMYLDNPASSLVLQNLREDGYQGPLILLSGPSQGATLGSHFFGRHQVLQLPMQIAGAYELAELRTAVAACLTSASRASQG